MVGQHCYLSGPEATRQDLNSGLPAGVSASEGQVLVVPSLWEASSLVSMEAMAAGVAVLGSDCPGLREVLRGTPARTVPAGDAAALARALRGAIVAPWTAEARAYAPAARARFDNAHSARRLTALYDELT